MAPVMQLQSQLKSNKMEIQTREQQIRSAEARIEELQSHLGGTPAVQAEMMNLTRDYQTTQRSYVDLLDKKNASALATNLERQQQGEQFRIIDPPSLPDKRLSLIASSFRWPDSASAWPGGAVRSRHGVPG